MVEVEPAQMWQISPTTWWWYSAHNGTNKWNYEGEISSFVREMLEIKTEIYGTLWMLEHVSHSLHLKCLWFPSNVLLLFVDIFDLTLSFIRNVFRKWCQIMYERRLETNLKHFVLFSSSMEVLIFWKIFYSTEVSNLPWYHQWISLPSHNAKTCYTTLEA